MLIPPGAFTNPSPENVRAGTAYYFNSSAVVGTLEAGGAGGINGSGILGMV